MTTKWWRQNTLIFQGHSFRPWPWSILQAENWFLWWGSAKSGARSRTSTSTLLVEKGLREARTLTCILNTHRLKFLLGGLGQFRQVQATQTQRHRHRSKRTPETYRQRKMRRERGREKGEGGWMEHDIGAGEVSGSERKQNRQNRSSGLMKFSQT